MMKSTYFFPLFWGPLQGRNDLVDDLADVFFLFLLVINVENRIPRAAWCWCELFDFLGLLTCLCDLHAGLACNYCLANHYPSDGVCLECVEQDPGFPGMLPWCFRWCMGRTALLFSACFLFGGAPLDLTIMTWNAGVWCVSGSEGVVFFL